MGFFFLWRVWLLRPGWADSFFSFPSGKLYHFFFFLFI